MSSPLPIRTRAPFRRRGALTVALAGAVLLALMGSITGVIPTALSAASAATEPEAPSPSPSLIPSPSPTPIDSEFTFDTADGVFYQSGSVGVSGSKNADATVNVYRGTGGGEPACTFPAGSSSWSCQVTIQQGTTTLTVRQLAIDGLPEQSASITARTLPAPSWDGSSPQLTSGLITGTGNPGSSILLNGSALCATVQANGYWSCPLPLPSGTHTVSVAQSWPGATSEVSNSTGSRSVTVDKDKPLPPAITSPTAGASVTVQPATFSGTGEEGALVSVYVDNALVCNAPVANGQWTCAAGGLAAGPHTVKSLQQDAAGNYSGAGPEVAFSIAEAAAAPPPGTLPPSPSATPSPAPAPPPAPEPAPSPSTDPAPSPTPSSPFFPPPVGGDSGLPPYQTWGTPTQYGAAIPSVTRSVSDNLWLGGALLAIAFVALLALPLRLLTSALRDRVPLRVARFAGRNRETRSGDDDTPLLNPWVTAAGALIAAALLAALAGGIQAEVRYLRLIVAIGIALTLLNGVAIALAAALGSRMQSLRSRFRLVPTFLAIAGISALLSRFGGIQPPVIIGVVIAAVLAAELSVRSRGLIGLSQLVLVLVLGVGGWLGHSAMGPVVGFWASLGSETLAALTISALGSFALLILPVGRLPGATLFEWSVPVWVAVALAGVTLGGTVIASGAGFPAFVTLGIAALFAVISVTIWSWLRYIQPQLVTPEAAAQTRAQTSP